MINQLTPVTVAEHHDKMECGEAGTPEANGELRFLKNGGWCIDLMQFSSKRIQQKDMAVVIRPDIF